MPPEGGNGCDAFGSCGRWLLQEGRLTVKVRRCPRGTKTARNVTYEMIKALAERYGTRVIESEIVGLTPAKALIDCAEFYLKAKDFDCKKQVMEYHLIDME